MSARHKLNGAAISGCIVVGALVGFATSSWAAFWIVSILLCFASLVAGDIRLTPHGRK